MHHKVLFQAKLCWNIPQVNCPVGRQVLSSSVTPEETAGRPRTEKTRLHVLRVLRVLRVLQAFSSQHGLCLTYCFLSHSVP